jgi:hypothetical protein
MQTGLARRDGAYFRVGAQELNIQTINKRLLPEGVDSESLFWLPCACIHLAARALCRELQSAVQRFQGRVQGVARALDSQGLGAVARGELHLSTCPVEHIPTLLAAARLLIGKEGA